MDKLILVTGATGYIASRLIPRLLDAGYRVRCLARNPLRLKGRSWSRDVEVVQGEITTPSTLAPALEGIHTAYYLVHNMSYGHGYIQRELEGAHTFASSAATAGVEHIIYLGGLAEPEKHIAPHMRSRIETGNTLRQGKVPVTEFRAGVIAGSGSISFEMIRFMTELCPIIPGPLWMKNKSQPIAIQNVIDYLLAALENPNGRGQIFEIGGPGIATYRDLMLRYASIRGLQRGTILLPGIPLWFMAFGVGLMTPVPYPIAYALIGGLANDSVVQHDQACKIFPEVKLIDFNSATKYALARTHPDFIEPVWEDGQKKAKFVKHEGCFIDYKIFHVHAGPAQVIQAINKYASKLASFRDSKLSDSKVLVCLKDNSVGTQWIQWQIETVDTSTLLKQTVFYSPRGLPGFLYWFLLYPFHQIYFSHLIKRIAKQSEEYEA